MSTGNHVTSGSRSGQSGIHWHYPRPTQQADPRYSRYQGLTVPSHPLLQHVIGSIFSVANGRKDAWGDQDDTSMPPQYVVSKPSKRVFKSDVRISLAPPQGFDIADGGDQDNRSEAAITRANEESWRQVLGLNGSTVKVLMACFGLWFAETGGADADQSVQIHVNDILDRGGWKKHPHGGYRRIQKDAVVQDVLTLGNLRVKTELFYHEGTDSKSKKTLRVNGPFLHVEAVIETGVQGEERPRAFLIRPGAWVKASLGNSRQTAELPGVVLTYKTQQGVGRTSSRLGLYLPWQFRIRAFYKNNDQPFAVLTLLTGASMRVPTDSRQQARFRKHFDEALDNLQTDGVIGAWEYESRDEAHRPRQWFARWLKEKVSILPSKTVVERYSGIAQKAMRRANKRKREPRS
jgi:hypothetical protein